MAKVVVDESTCVGCGLCEQACPEVFKVDDSGIAKIIANNSEAEGMQDAIDQCPVTAITLE